jgi:hypothetical protein
LQRSFNVLAGRQQEGANQSGLVGGGALLQAAAKRKVNQGVQQQGLDMGLRRGTEDLATQYGRLDQDTSRGIGQLGVGYNRQVTDSGTALSRAERENTAFGLDVNAQRYFQAAQSGWEPPKRPGRR